MFIKYLAPIRQYLLFQLIFIMLILFSAAPASAAEQKIKVAFPQLHNFSLGEAESNSGYIYDYLQELAKYTGWEYEFIPFDGNSAAERERYYQLLENGEIDLLAPVTRTEKHLRRFAFPTYSIGSMHTALLVNPNDMRFNEQGYNIRPLIVALCDTEKEQLENVKILCAANHINFTAKYYASKQALADALRHYEIDALLVDNFYPSENVRTFINFAEQEYYLVAAKENLPLIAKLDEALTKLRLTTPNFTADLQQTYFAVNSSPALFLTAEEKAYIDQNKNIRVILMPPFAPFQQLDENGNPQGIIVDTMRYIAEQADLSLEFLPTATVAEAMEKLRGGDGDIIAGVSEKKHLTQEYGFITTAPVLPLPIAMVKNNNFKFTSYSEKNLAIDQSFVDVVTPQLSMRSDKTYRQIAYPSFEDALEAVNDEDAELTYGSALAAEYYARNAYLQNISIVIQPQFNKSLYLALGKDANPLLLSVLNKSISTLTPAMRQDIINQTALSSVHKLTVQNLIRGNPLLCILVTAAIAAFFIACIAAVLRNKLRYSRKIAIDNQRYKILSNLCNEYIFEYDYKRDVLSVGDKFAAEQKCPAVIADFLSGIEAGQTHFANIYFEKAFTQMLKSGKNSYEIQYRLPDNRKTLYFQSSSALIEKEKMPILRVGKLTDITEEKKEKKLLIDQARRDSLTVLLNKKTTQLLMAEYLAQASPEEYCLVSMFDVDNFKNVNDSYGHPFGDVVLQDTAKALSEACGNDNIAGRIGGDEFSFLIKNVTKEEAAAFAEKLIERLRIVYSKENYQLSVSMGLVIVPGGSDCAAALKHADEALYEAKANGKNSFAFYKEPGK